MSKRTILTTIIIPVLLISGLIFVLINNPQEPSAELILAHQQIHFGTLAEWEGPVTRSLTARNVGSNTVHIQSVHTGCSYAEITAPDTIPADAAGTLHITINPETLSADETSATAIIFTDSPKTPNVSLTIIATAKRFATLTPDVCEFGNILPETKYQKTLTLTVNAPLNTSDIRLLPSSHPRLTWKMTSDRSLITVQLGRLKDRGHFSSLLTVAFPNERTLTLPVTAKVIAPVIAQPERLIYERAAPRNTAFTRIHTFWCNTFQSAKDHSPRRFKRHRRRQHRRIASEKTKSCLERPKHTRSVTRRNPSANHSRSPPYPHPSLRIHPKQVGRISSSQLLVNCRYSVAMVKRNLMLSKGLITDN